MHNDQRGAIVKPCLLGSRKDSIGPRRFGVAGFFYASGAALGHSGTREQWNKAAW